MTRRNSRRTTHEVMDAEWRMARDWAETVPCRDCHQPTGNTCLNLRTGEPLDRLPAHSNRIHDADLAGKP